MCSVLKVSRGGFYKWTVSTLSKRSIENQKLEAEVLQAFENSKKNMAVLGSP
jgi:putative transposase